MKQGSISAINDTEVTVEEMVEQITIGKVELMQNYASYLDVGYIDCESDMWSTLIYYPSPEMPKKSMSEHTYWYIFMDLYMVVLDRLTDCLQTVKLQKCKCGFTAVFFYGHIMQYHYEFINPDGTVKGNAISELQETESNEQSSIRQEVSDKADDRTNQETQNKEHNREAEPAQSVSYGHRSDQQEVPSPEKSNPREAADNAM